MMPRQQVTDIAADAANLLDALKDREFNFEDCMKLLVSAMPAIVTANDR